MTVLNQHAGFKRKKTHNYILLRILLPPSRWWAGKQHIVIFYVVILLHVYCERKGSLPGHKLSNLVITWKIRSFVWFFNPLFWLYGLPLISYYVTVWFPLKRNSPVLEAFLHQPNYYVRFPKHVISQVLSSSKRKNITFEFTILKVHAICRLSEVTK